MRILFITDLHGCRAQVAAWPAADLLLAGGDLTHFGGAEDMRAIVADLRARYPRVLAVAGNCDTPAAAAWLDGDPAGVALRLSRVAHLRVFGIGGSNRTPCHTPNEWDDAEFAAPLAAAWRQAGEPAPGYLLLSHPPPAGSGAGCLPGGPDVGSAAVAALAARTRPALVCCGHIHEAVGIHRLGDVPVVNPGAARDGHWALVEWRPGAVPTVTLDG